MTPTLQAVAPGIWRLSFGDPDKLTPLTYRQYPIRQKVLSNMQSVDRPPIDPGEIGVRQTRRGLTILLPAKQGEDFYGGGLQLKSFRQTGLRKQLRVNSDPVADTGDSHAPVPFYLSTAGYGVYVDTLRISAFHFASHPRRGAGANTANDSSVNTDPATLYAARPKSGCVEIDLPATHGVDLYLFAGPSMDEALRRYVLFSGGGALPPMWGLGVWYRCYGRFNQQQAIDLAKRLRERQLPCDVYGLEPGWQSNAYPCSFTWHPGRFPDPSALIGQLGDMGYRVNLWEHAFAHPAAPFYEAMLPHAGSHEAFAGLVPDFTTAAARDLFATHHDKNLIGPGVLGFKLDECDGSDFISFPWSFPDHAEFPGGLDGEQYHAVFGTLYAHTIEGVFRQHDRRTLGSVRNLGALSAPLPYVLYSDLYDHRDFIRGVLTAGICGLLWTPEVRDAKNMEDLIRRLQSVVLSPQALINAWYISLPPWEQTARELNEQGQRQPNWETHEAAVRDVLKLRMRLLPYLYAAFARYSFEGRPPFRPLVLDYPDDPALRAVDDQYMIGPNLMAAPMVAGQKERSVALPKGDWCDFFTGQRLSGGRSIQHRAGLDRAPLFVKADSVVLLAEPVQCVRRDTLLRIVPHIFGSPREPAELFEDDGETFAWERGEYAWVSWSPDGKVARTGGYRGPARYEFAPPVRVGES